MESEKIKVVLVHSGNIFPEYIDDCIAQLKKYNFEIHLILSEKLHQQLKSKDIVLVKAEEYENQQYKHFFVNRDNTFRDGFWTRTSSRFFLLNEYSKRKNLNNFFHIENDILVFDSFNKVSEALLLSNKKAFLVIDAPDRCVPSVLWFRDSQILDSLCNFIYSNNSNDDMKNLNMFFKNNLETVGNLPIFPTEKYNSDNLKYNNMFDVLNSIFDGAAIGQYIGGIDPRSVSGNTVGFINETTIFNVSLYKIEWVNREPYIIYNNKQTKINNLHMHCKNLKIFSGDINE